MGLVSVRTRNGSEKRNLSFITFRERTSSSAALQVPLSSNTYSVTHALHPPNFVNDNRTYHHHRVLWAVLVETKL